VDKNLAMVISAHGLKVIPKGMDTAMTNRQECVCGHDGPTEHALSGECKRCACELFDWKEPRIVIGEFPDGVICGECDRPFADGDRFAEQILSDDGTPVTIRVCEPCGGLK
jgi:hypothetical protein